MLFYFGLLTGATLGGNLTPIGASANIAAIGILRKNGETVRTRRTSCASACPSRWQQCWPGQAYLWLVWGRVVTGGRPMGTLQKKKRGPPAVWPRKTGFAGADAVFARKYARYYAEKNAKAFLQKMLDNSRISVV